MSPVEDDIRAALHAEGERLRPLKPLRLPPPDTRPGGWLVPALAGAIVVLIAIGLVAVKAINDGAAHGPARPVPATSRSDFYPAGTPRYYVSLAGITDVNDATTLVVGDSLTGARLATIPAPKGTVFIGTTPAAASDDRTFIVGEASQEPKSHPPVATTSPLGWYLVRISPGARPQVQMTRLPIQVPAADGTVGGAGQMGDMALSADGTRLAVLFSHGVAVKGLPAGTAAQQALRVYSVSSGQLLNTWYGTVIKPGNEQLAEDLSWAGGDSTVAFALTWGLDAHTQIRTVDISAGGTGLLADSHVVWSQYVPLPPGELYTLSTPYPCTTPYLAASGQAVVCAYPSYPPGDKHHVLAWVEYPLSGSRTPRLLGSVPLPPGKLSSASGRVEWVSPAGNEVIGMWQTIIVGQFKHGSAPTTVRTYVGVAAGGVMRPLNAGTFAPTGEEAW